MKLIIKLTLVIVFFQSLLFAGRCEAPGSPSKYIPTESQIIQNVYSHKKQYWFCVSNPYKKEFRIKAQIKGSHDLKYRNLSIRLYDINMQEIRASSGGKGHGGLRKIRAKRAYKKLDKGQYYLLIDVRTKFNENMAIYVDGYGR